MPDVNFFFLGYELDDKLNENLNNCKQSDRSFLEDPAYLEIITIEKQQYVGRRLGSVISAIRSEDTARNVKSLILRLFSQWNQQASAAILIAVKENSDDSFSSKC